MLTGKHKNTRPPASSAEPVSVPSEQQLKPTKAYVAAVVTLLGLVGIHVTTGTAQALVMAGQLLLVVYGVWRARNNPRRARRRGGVERFL